MNEILDSWCNCKFISGIPMRNCTQNITYFYDNYAVKFRIIPVKPNLLSAHGSMDVYAIVSMH